jgi:hypothetical protein
MDPWLSHSSGGDDQKLLFEEDLAVGLELAELFYDAGKTYQKISGRINETYLPHHSLQD